MAEGRAHVKCPKCNGCGKVADTEDQEPWTVWAALSLQSAAAVLAGIVRPRPCPLCGGTGKIDTAPAPQPAAPAQRVDPGLAGGAIKSAWWEAQNNTLCETDADFYRRFCESLQQSGLAVVPTRSTPKQPCGCCAGTGAVSADLDPCDNCDGTGVVGTGDACDLLLQHIDLLAKVPSLAVALSARSLVEQLRQRAQDAAPAQPAPDEPQTQVASMPPLLREVPTDPVRAAAIRATDRLGAADCTMDQETWRRLRALLLVLDAAPAPDALVDAALAIFLEAESDAPAEEVSSEGAARMGIEAVIAAIGGSEVALRAALSEYQGRLRHEAVCRCGCRWNEPHALGCGGAKPEDAAARKRLARVDAALALTPSTAAQAVQAVIDAAQRMKRGEGAEQFAGTALASTAAEIMSVLADSLLGALAPLSGDAR